jgi:Spy/CpxP family protein refolding chaperone
MKRHTLLALAAAAVLLPLAPAAVRAASPEEAPMEGPRGGGGWRNGEARLEKDLKELGLTPAQDEKIRAILAQSKSAREARFEKLRPEFERMQTLLEADTPDEAAVMAQVDKIGALKNEQHKAMLHTLLQIRAELTPEQRTQLKAKMREHGPGGGRWFRGGMRHGGMRGGPPPEPPDEE